MIKSGNEDAFRELLENHRRMIYKIIYSFPLDKGDFRIDENDLFQEACIALYEAVFSFQKERNVRFSTYAYMLMKSRITSHLRRLSRSQGEELFSLDAADDHLMKLAVKEDPAMYHREEEFRKQLERFMSSLNDEDRQILELKNEDHSYREISEELRIPVKRIDNRLRSLRKRFRKDFMTVLA